MNRQQISPRRLRPRNIEIDVNRIINHAAKLAQHCDQLEVNSIIQTDRENQVKIKELLKLSATNLPKLINRSRNRKHYKHNKYDKDHRGLNNSSKKIPVIAEFCLESENIASSSDDDTVSSHSKINISIKSKESIENDVLPTNIISPINDNMGNPENKSSSQSNLTPHRNGSNTEDDLMLSNETVDDAVTLNSQYSLSNEFLLAKIENKTEQGNEKILMSDKSDINREAHQLLSNDTIDEVMTLTSEHSLKESELDNYGDTRFLYEIEITTGAAENIHPNDDVFIIMKGDTVKITKKLYLMQYLKSNDDYSLPFQSGNTDIFQVYVSDYLGTIQNVVIGFDSISPDVSWFLESICIKDTSLYKSYRFPCRRWLGAKSVDRLTEVKLGYTHPFKKDKYFRALMSFDENRCNNTILKSDKDSRSSVSTKIILSQSPHKSPGSWLQYSPREPTLNGDNISDTINSKGHHLIAGDTSIDDETGKQITVLFGRSIHSAVKHHDLDLVKDLCSFYEKLKCSENADGNAPIHIAAIYYRDVKECQEIINYLISLNIDPNSRSRDGYTPLLLAVSVGNIDSVKYFNEIIKVNLNDRDNVGNTALHLALLNGNIMIAKYLVSAGADITIRNEFGESPLDIAQMNNHQEVFIILNKIVDTNIGISSDNIYNKSVQLTADGKPTDVNVVKIFNGTHQNQNSNRALKTENLVVMDVPRTDVKLSTVPTEKEKNNITDEIYQTCFKTVNPIISMNEGRLDNDAQRMVTNDRTESHITDESNQMRATSFEHTLPITSDATPNGKPPTDVKLSALTDDKEKDTIDIEIRQYPHKPINGTLSSKKDNPDSDVPSAGVKLSTENCDKAEKGIHFQTDLNSEESEDSEDIPLCDVSSSLSTISESTTSEVSSGSSSSLSTSTYETSSATKKTDRSTVDYREPSHTNTLKRLNSTPLNSNSNADLMKLPKSDSFPAYRIKTNKIDNAIDETIAKQIKTETVKPCAEITNETESQRI